jgi:N4-gp56 family major capsid protein
LRHALAPICKFRQFCDIKEDWGKGVGDTLYWNKVSAIATAGGTLVETDVIPAHAFSIARGTIALSEWGNSIPFTGKLEALSEYDVKNPIIRVLRDDMASVLDKAAGLEFKKTGRKYTATSTIAGTLESIADGDTLGSGKNVKGGWRLYHIEEVVAEMKKRNIPKWDGDNYMCIASVNFVRQLMKDADWKNDVRYGDPERLFAGEIGRIRGVRFVEETNYLINTIGSGGDYGEAVIFGKEAVIEGIAIPEEIRSKIPTDYGRSEGLAWYGLSGWEKMWKHTDTNQDAHIFHLTGKS